MGGVFRASCLSDCRAGLASPFESSVAQEPHVVLLAQSEVELATSVTVFWFVLRTSVEQATCALLLLVCFDSPEMPDTPPPCHQSLSA